MSLLKTIRQQLGLSNTPANNFTLDASADDGTMKLARGNAGATTQDILTVDAAGKVSIPQGLLPVAGSGVNIKTTASAPYTAASGELLSRPHGLAFVPSSAKLVLECVVADNGHSVGDRVHCIGIWNGSSIYPSQVYVDATNCGSKAVGGYSHYIPHKTTGSAVNPTANAWKYCFEVIA
jgi:hypothetical protein